MLRQKTTRRRVGRIIIIKPIRAQAVAAAAGAQLVDPVIDLGGLVERLYQEATQKVLGVVQYTEVRKSKLY